MRSFIDMNSQLRDKRGYHRFFISSLPTEFIRRIVHLSGTLYTSIFSNLFFFCFSCHICSIHNNSLSLGALVLLPLRWFFAKNAQYIYIVCIVYIHSIYTIIHSIYNSIYILLLSYDFFPLMYLCKISSIFPSIMI